MPFSDYLCTLFVLKGVLGYRKAKCEPVSVLGDKGCSLQPLRTSITTPPYRVRASLSQTYPSTILQYIENCAWEQMIQAPRNIYSQQKMQAVSLYYELDFLLSFLLLFIYSNKKYTGPYLWRLKTSTVNLYPLPQHNGQWHEKPGAHPVYPSYPFTPAPKYCHSNSIP